jgi:hypothetical protein
MWMGGVPPPRYAIRERKLIIVEPEAESVRHIFSHYAGCGCCNKCSQPAASPARSG